METIEQVNDDFNVKKPKKKGLIITGIVAAVVVIALVLVYFLVFAKPQFIFNSAIDKLFKMETKNYDSIKFDSKVKVSLEAKDSSMQEQLAEVEKYAVKIGAQMDFEKEQEIVELGLEYDKESVVDAQVYYNNENMYMYFEGLFDKYIKVDMEEEQKEQIKAIFDTASSEENTKNSKKAMKIVRDELKSELKEYGEFEKEKATIEVGDKERKVTKHTLTLSQKELYNLFANMCANLAKDDDFLDCFKESPKDSLKEIAEQVKSAEADSKNNIKISIYTKGLLNKFVGLDIAVYSKEDDQTTTMSIVNEEKDLYTYKVCVKTGSANVDALKGEIEIEKDKGSKNEESGKIKITAEIVEIEKAKLEISYSMEYNQGIDKIDTSNSVDMTSITEEEVQSIMEKLMERPLIGTLIENAMNGNGIGDLTEDYITDGTDDITTEKLTTSENEVKDDYYGYSVKYSVPKGFEYDNVFSSDYRKYYKLEDTSSEIEAEVSIEWETDEEHRAKIKENYEYYKNDASFYKNVNLGEVKTIKVGDTEVKYQIISYESNSEYYSEKYQTAYIWYNLDDTNVFTVELESTDKDITEDIIKGFLNINVNKI